MQLHQNHVGLYPDSLAVDAINVAHNLPEYQPLPINKYAGYLLMQAMPTDKNNYSLYHDYLVNSRNKKNEYDPKDDIALLVVASEIVRKERNGKWMLIKRDAVYNPYYEPAIYLENDEYISMEFAALHSLSNGITISHLQDVVP